MNKTLGMLKFMMANTKNKKNEIALQECIKELEDLQNRSCENCKYCSFIIDSSIKCDFFECYQQKSLKFCGNWES